MVGRIIGTVKKRSMMRVKLKAKTRHGKNRIHQHGDVWWVTHKGHFRGRPALSLQSLERTFMGNFDGRWVLERNDENFEWQEVE